MPPPPPPTPFTSSRSPPPLQHPKPTHPAYPPPEPPHTPGYSPRLSVDTDGYTRYSSPPVTAHAAQGQGQGPVPAQMIPEQTYGGASTSAYAPGAPGSAPHNRAYGQMQPNPAAGRNPNPNAPMGYGNQFPQWPPMNDATAQMGMQFAGNAMQAGHDYMEKNINRYLPLALLKTCFSVTNGYVLNKLRLVLFPWRHRPWTRKVKRASDNGSVDSWQPPREDINAPDLYIPTMALVTYTLLAALSAGVRSRFHPEILGVALSKALGVVFVEFLGIKLGCYLLDVKGGGGASGVELIGYAGYKFVGIIATVLVSLLNLGNVITVATFVYTFAANAFFLLRSLKYVLLPDSSSTPTAATLSHAQRSRRVQFLFIVAVMQGLWMGLLSRV